jgi:hypothetical protein
MAADDMAKAANLQQPQNGDGTQGSADSQDSTKVQDSASAKDAAKVAYQKKVEDNSGRDWTKRRTFKPTNGV